MKEDSGKEKSESGGKKKPTRFDVVLCLSAVLCVAALAVTVTFQFKSFKEIEKYEAAATTKGSIENLGVDESEILAGKFSVITTDTQGETESFTHSEAETASGLQNSVTNTQQKDNITTSRKNNKTENKTTAKKPIETNTTDKPSEKITEIDSVLIINKKSKKIHSSTCPYAKNINEENRFETTGDKLQDYIDNGYSVCGHCNAYK